MSLYIRRILENEKRTAHLTQDFMLALAKAVDAKDHYTSGHSQRVARYSREIARRMGKSEQEQQEIYLMGLLHDIGKIGVPETIINKNGRLTDEEFKKIKEHPVVGHEILQNIEEMPALATGARWHHELYDGHGYPDSLSGENIPEEARIICVADSYDAMTSNRAYSNIRPQEQVRSEIIRCRGTQFDPKIADVMVQMIDEDTHYSMHG
jgi:putative nucleotidyltransferase with HDIG domain